MVFVFYFDIIDPGRLRPMAAPVYHFTHGRVVAFDYCLHAAVRQVTHPARDAMLFCSQLRVLPEIDALDLAGHKDMGACFNQSKNKKKHPRYDGLFPLLLLYATQREEGEVDDTFFLR